MGSCFCHHQSIEVDEIKVLSVSNNLNNNNCKKAESHLEESLVIDNFPTSTPKQINHCQLVIKINPKPILAKLLQKHININKEQKQS